MVAVIGVWFGELHVCVDGVVFYFLIMKAILDDYFILKPLQSVSLSFFGLHRRASFFEVLPQRSHLYLCSGLGGLGASPLPKHFLSPINIVFFTI